MRKNRKHEKHLPTFSTYRSVYMLHNQHREGREEEFREGFLEEVVLNSHLRKNGIWDMVTTALT